MFGRFEKLIHPLSRMGLVWSVGQVVMLVLTLWSLYEREWMSSAFCIVMLYLFGIQKELEQTHECVHKLGVLMGMMSMPGMAEQLQSEVQRIEQAIKDGQKPEDVVK